MAAVDAAALGVDPEIAARASRVRLLILDVDGVLTDGRVLVVSDGRDAREFNARDGLGIRLGQRAGLRFAVLSGRSSEAVARRAAELEIEEVHQGVSDKHACYVDLRDRLSLLDEAVCFVGDDLVDVPVFRQVGFAVAPADAEEHARLAAHWVTRRRGGQGAVRETIDLVLKASGRWDAAVRRFLGG